MASGYHWVRVSNLRSMPKGAVKGGCDSNGGDIYVGQGYYNSIPMPAKVIPSRGDAYVCHAGKEHSVRNVDVLCERSMTWVPVSEGVVPCGAVPAGHDGCGEQYFVGRARHNGTLTVGKIHPSHKCLYVPYGGYEHRYNRYEALVYQ